MSRSRKKFPLVCDSKKWDKKFSARKLRRLIKKMLFRGDTEILPTPKEVYDLWWVGQGDGACHFDDKEFPDLMRK